MLMKILGGVLAGIGAVGTVWNAINWYEIAAGIWTPLDAAGNAVGCGPTIVKTVICAVVAIIGIVLLILGIKNGKKKSA